MSKVVSETPGGKWFILSSSDTLDAHGRAFGCQFQKSTALFQKTCAHSIELELRLAGQWSGKLRVAHHTQRSGTALQRFLAASTTHPLLCRCGMTATLFGKRRDRPLTGTSRPRRVLRGAETGSAAR